MVGAPSIGIAVIGAGQVARRGHLPAFKAQPGMDVLAIMDIDAGLAERVAAEFQIPHWCASHETLLEVPNVDLVDICTPPQMRFPIIEAAARAGKHILVEKPLATSLSDALAIREVVNRHGVLLNLVTNYRYFPAVLKAKERIASGRLGRIVTMNTLASQPFPSDNTRSTWFYHPAGMFFDFAPHVVDLLMWLCDGIVERVVAFGQDVTGGDMGFTNYLQLLMEFDSRAIASADISWVTGTSRFTVDVHGTGGHISIDVRNNSFLEFHGFFTPLDDTKAFLRRVLGITRDVLTGKYFQGAFAYYPRLMQEFIGSIHGIRRAPSPVEQGLMVTAVLDGAHQSLCHGGTPVCIRDLFPSPALYEETVAVLTG